MIFPNGYPRRKQAIMEEELQDGLLDILWDASP